jgi:phosphopantothenoylcysteine decarboxylase/phosphopantothenate--cysteine ligase
VRFIPIETAIEMRDAVMSELPSSDVLIMSAAVSDFMPQEKSGKKIGKKDGMLLRLSPAPDIISEAAGERKRPFIIGFAAETGGKTEAAKKKLREKKIDLIVFNDVTEPGAGFDVDTNKVVLIDRQKETELPLMSKDSVADAILDRFIEMKA